MRTLRRHLADFRLELLQAHHIGPVALEPFAELRGARSKTCSETKLPSLRNTCSRSLPRSQTYTRLSTCESRMQCTGLENCSAGGFAGSYGGVLSSLGRLPKAPQWRL